MNPREHRPTDVCWHSQVASRPPERSTGPARSDDRFLAGALPPHAAFTA
jgi:hypothetical protein